MTGVPKPFTSASEHAEACFRVITWRLRAWHVSRRLAFVASDDPFRLLEHLDRYVPTTFSPVEQATLQPAIAAAQLAQESAQRLESALQTRLQATAGAVADGSVWLPIEELRAALGLGDGSVWLLWWLLLHGTCPPFAETVKGLLPTGYRQPTLGLALEMLGVQAEQAAEVYEATGPGGALRRLGLVRLDGGETNGRSHAVPWLPDDVVDLLLASQVPEARASAPAPLGLPAEAQQAIERALRPTARVPQARGVLLLGLPGVGRRAAVEHVAAREGRRLLTVGTAADTVDGFVDQCAAALRRGLATGAALLLRVDRPSGEWAPPHTARLIDLLRAYGLPVFFTASERGSFPLGGLLDEEWALQLSWDATAHGEPFWERAIERFRLSYDGPLADLSARVHATPGTIMRTLERWRRLQPRTRANEPLPLDVGSFVALLDAVNDQQLGSIAEPLSTTLDWDDLVVPDELAEQLRDVLIHARHQALVFRDWGFRDKMPYGRGLAALFHGPPGTGKTMAATLMAKSLGRPLYRIDLSRIIDKYIGETEKNLARLFAIARTSNAVLMFDEADSLFSSRTEVRSSNDRYANLEVNFLLQKIEDFEGVAILTTNNAEAIDPAFKRRLRFSILFPEPTVEDRVRMWSSFIPDGAPVEPDVDFQTLGREYDISGGHIKQAVLRAAFRAAAMDRPISGDDFHLAAAQECRDLGKLVSVQRRNLG